MKIIPLQTIVLLSILVGLVSFFGIGYWDSRIQEASQPTFQPDAPGGEEIIARDQAQLSGPQLPLDLLVASISVLISFLVLSTGYRYYLNSSELRDYLITSLALAGFDQEIGVAGRTWDLEDVPVVLQLLPDLSFRVIVEISSPDTDPRMYGLIPRGDHPELETGFESLQMSLLGVRRYCDAVTMS